MLTAITFDFWQTLYADSDSNWQQRQTLRTEYCWSYLKTQGYTCTQNDVRFGLDEAYDLVMTRWHKHEGVSVDRCMQRFGEALELPLQTEEIAQLITCLGEAFLAEPPVIMPHIKPVLQRLSERYRIGIISDSALTPGSFVRKLMERDAVLQYFSALTFSDETDYTKPQVVQFQNTLAQLNAAPENALHIGDIFRTDIVGAKNTGMLAIRFAGFNKGMGDDTQSDAVIEDYRELEAVITELIN